jgi:hypothetical protein
MSKPLLDAAYRARALKLLTDRHGSSLHDEHFEIDARKEEDNVVVICTLRSADRTYVYTMEACVPRQTYPAVTPAEALEISLDFLDWYLGEFFREERDAFLPLDWKVMRFGDIEIMAKGDLRNEFLDEAADAWLRGERPDVESAWKSLRRKH